MVPRKELPEEVTGELRLNDEKGQARPGQSCRPEREDVFTPVAP